MFETYNEEVTAAEVVEIAVNMRNTNQFPLLISWPGLGKSSVAESIAKEMESITGRKFPTHTVMANLATTPDDVYEHGIKVNADGSQETVRSLKQWQKDAMTGAVIIMEEWSAARGPVQAAYLDIFSGRRFFEDREHYAIHPDTVIIGCMNDRDDTAYDFSMLNGILPSIANPYQTGRAVTYLFKYDPKLHLDALDKDAKISSYWKTIAREFFTNEGVDICSNKEAPSCPRTFDAVLQCLSRKGITGSIDEKTARLYVRNRLSWYGEKFIQYVNDRANNMVKGSDILNGNVTITEFGDFICLLPSVLRELSIDSSNPTWIANWKKFVNYPYKNKDETCVSKVHIANIITEQFKMCDMLKSIANNEDIVGDVTQTLIDYADSRVVLA